MKFARWRRTSLLVGLGLLWAARGEARPTVTVASKNFVESRILGELMAQAIEGQMDVEVRRKLNLGGTLICFQALESGSIDLYPEYTGTGWAAILRKDTSESPLKTFLEVQEIFRRRFQLEWLPPFGFNNTYALAMREDVAKRHKISRISDLVPHQEGFRVGFSAEFLSRTDGYPGLAAAYGLKFGSVRAVEHGLIYQAIRDGQLDLVDAYSTDGKLLRYPLRVLEDDRAFFPPYHAAPVVREATLKRWPRLREVLGALSFQISDEAMQKLNHEVETEGRSEAEVVRDFLARAGLVADKDGPATPSARRSVPRDERSFWGVFWRRRAETASLLWAHILLTATAVLLAASFAIPLGIGITRRPRLRQVVLASAGAIQTVPSLALVALMIPVPGLGLGATSAVVALFLYALLPVLRNTYTGIQSVEAGLVDAARGIGLTESQILRHVELPLAARTIMAGVRTATVISIGVATLAAFIGAGGLGEPIITGLQLNDANLILSGAVPAAVLALAADYALGRLEARLAPRGVGAESDGAA